MLRATIRALATAVPPESYSQRELFERVTPYFGASRHIRAIFDHTAIECRHTVVDLGYYDRERRTEERNRRYLSEAVPLASQAVHRCLGAAGIGVDGVDDLIVVSCTGIDTPGLDLRLAGELGMRPDLRRTCVLGMGCYGAMPGLLRAQQAVLARPGRTALLVAVELCSLHFQPEDRSMQNVVASALFADGAAAVLVSSEPGTPKRRAARASDAAFPDLVDSASYCDYTTFDQMAFHLTDHGFQMRLSAYVPELLAADVEHFVDDLLARNGLDRRDVRFWAVHPGSSKILDHVEDRLGLAHDELRFSRAVLRDYGNMSSPTVLFVLDEIERRGEPRAGDYGVLMAFGPGLTMESALVRW